MIRKSLAGMIALTLPAALSAQTFDNSSVVALRRAGLGESAIVAKVESMPCGYDVSTDALIALKRANVPDQVIVAMVKRCGATRRTQGASMTAADPLAAHAPGIYVAGVGNTAAMQMMRPSKASSIKVSGNGSLLWPFTGKLVLPESRSRLPIVDHQPIFYFYFPTNERNAGEFGTPNAPAQSPDEFSLVRFKVKGNEREVGIGRQTAYTAQRGIDVKETVAFQSDELGGSSFRVEPKQDMPPGEYAFVLTGASNAARVYDFTIE